MQAQRKGPSQVERIKRRTPRELRMAREELGVCPLCGYQQCSGEPIRIELPPVADEAPQRRWWQWLLPKRSVAPAGPQPTYFVKHPDGSYTEADPQPVTSAVRGRPATAT